MKKIQLILAAACTLFVTSSYAQQVESVTSIPQSGTGIATVQTQQLTAEKPADVSNTNISLSMEKKTGTTEKSINAPVNTGKLQAAGIQTDMKKTMATKQEEHLTK